ncbi:hypothetical protein [Neptuniibacter sp.]|uniref:hypothetical protein n=1 Tax=Neptuniibacter sp. TaxID=1962643 RepID=UPI00260E0CEA|nr:hypothetical protein [Neptuniibacter sp.]MCP4597810.1 hypothetical protein [Neptuniibacter sp.]
MKHIKASYSFYTFFKYLGDAATLLLFYLVLRETGFNYSILLWMIPLWLLAEFGCFAERDRKHDYGR